MIDLFCGCGGMSRGFVDASPDCDGVEFVVCGAVDDDPHAVDSYERSLGLRPDEIDVRSLTTAEGLSAMAQRWGFDPSKPSVLIGCPPCQGFSSHRKKDPRLDARNSLMGVFGEIVVGLRPDIVVLENVPEMLRDKHWAHYEVWRSLLVDAGYAIRTRIVNMAEYGVPQERFRVCAIAARDWAAFDFPPVQLHHEAFRTVRDAIAHLPPLKSGERDPDDAMHVTSNHRRSTIDLISRIPADGGSRRSLPSGTGPDCHDRVDGFRDVYGRLWWDRPAVAITARCRTPSCGRFTHPEQHRGLTVREAALLQGFPADFHLCGPFDEKFKQVGNAVPPLFAQAVARQIAREWSLDHGEGRRMVDEHLDIRRPLTKSFSSSIAGIKRQRGRPAPTAIPAQGLP